MTDPTTMKSGAHESPNLIPFVVSLPKDASKYHEVLNLSQSAMMQSGLITLQAGQDIGSHNTGTHEELLVILEGIGEVELEGLGRRQIRKGCVAYVPPATQHNVFNVATEPLRYLYIVSRTE